MDDIVDKVLSEGSDYKEENAILEPLLDEIDLIEDQGIMSFVRSVLLKAPRHFWDSPSSKLSEYHPPDERNKGGNVLHVRRVVRIARILAEAQDRSAHERDLLTAACLLHDITKTIMVSDDEFHYDPMHPYTVDKFVEWTRQEDDKYGSEIASSSLWIDEEDLMQILRLVRCHMGIWSAIPETIPLSTLEWVMHFADLIASKLHFIIDGLDVQQWRWEKTDGG